MARAGGAEVACKGYSWPYGGAQNYVGVHRVASLRFASLPFASHRMANPCNELIVFSVVASSWWKGICVSLNVHSELDRTSKHIMIHCLEIEMNSLRCHPSVSLQIVSRRSLASSIVRCLCQPRHHHACTCSLRWRSSSFASHCLEGRHRYEYCSYLSKQHVL